MSDSMRLSQSDDIEKTPRGAADWVGPVPSIDRIMSLMPGFVYVFNHLTYANDYTNQSVGEHLGYSSEEIRDFGAQMLSEVIHPDDHPLLGAHMGRIARLADGRSVALEYRVMTKSGEQRWLSSVDTVFDRCADGRVLRHIGCASDITEQKQAELGLAELNAQLEEKVAARTQDLADLNATLEDNIRARTAQLQDAVDELEQLTYIATHDLKVPVNNLNRLGVMLKAGAHTLSAQQEEQIQWVSECAEQLSAKIQGLVLVAQIRLGEGPPPDALNLHQIVFDAIDKIHLIQGQAALSVCLDVPENLTVQFDRFELDTILGSLLDNAIKYADSSRPLRVTICGSHKANQVRLSVADNGTGLNAGNAHNPHDAAKAFGLFQRAHKTPAGNGISLYCARGMLARRGGSLGVEGTRGQGARFTISFAPEEDQK
ncbi:PAS domain-containing sensor histidine kinase [Sulfitobacter sp. F26169L]|uniref:sensor histidine kinase n=1 Tax=Sulfitobacter sp. F26169L TaxID=2996015 RepID=UPI00226092C0|nr:PAS domain-containing sensor histidine kinase [Sulfitobacter sp. F26169L]MCX7564952.1 PAS domain-containing sensor histidine kinase [Sulfitobacter sp. F26169L]